jgi:hypothetical protein
MSNLEENGQSKPDGTSSDANGPKDNGNQPDIPQLSPNEQFNVVALVVFAMITCIFIILAWWPAGPITDKDVLYLNKPFHVQPITLDNQMKMAPVDQSAITNSPVPVDPAITTLTKQVADQQKRVETLTKEAKPDSLRVLESAKKNYEESKLKLKTLTDKQAANEKAAAEKLAAKKAAQAVAVVDVDVCTIQLGNLILILVAAAGFLGNLIHVSKSLSYYIGMKEFQRSWIPWYVIKPFTASGLALLIYFATNSTSSAVNGQAIPINLTAIMLTAGLTGLFTDIATQKLKVIFEAILKPAENHSAPTDKPATPPLIKVPTVDMTKVIPEKINPKIVNQVKIPGQNLDPKNLVVKINDKVIDNSIITVTATMISFSYQPKGDDETATAFQLVVTDTPANLSATKTWAVV